MTLDATAILILALLAGLSEASEERIEFSGGAEWSSGYLIGTRAALLVENRVQGGPIALFDSSTTRGGVWGWTGRLAVRVVAGVHVEGTVAHAEPALRLAIRSDREGAPDTTVGGGMEEWQYTGSVRVDLIRKGQLIPFVLAGGGRIYQSDVGGTTYHAGGGFRVVVVSSPGLLKELGLRADGRVQRRSGGLDFEDRSRRSAAVTVGAFARFY